MNTPANTDFRIVIAEDEKHLLESMHYLFHRKGYTVFKAANGSEALAIISKQHAEGKPIDLLITDIQMPVMGGEELVRSVRTFTSTLRILAVTAFGDKELVVRLMRLGCRDFIDKPFRSAKLEEHVDFLLGEAHAEALDRKRKEHIALTEEKARSLVHDLNNMMCHTLGYADLALKIIEETHPVRLKLTKLFSSAQIGAEISNKLMGLKAESSRPIRTKTDLRTVVEKMSGVVRAIASDSVEIRTLSPEQPVWASIDCEQIQQVLLNMGINALDAMPDGGVLSYAASVEVVACEYDSTSKFCACITVTDTGCGISPANLVRLFTESFTTKDHGHGFGLMNVQRIVKENSGRIVTKSEVGKGTEFKLCFPFSHQSLPAESTTGRKS